MNDNQKKRLILHVAVDGYWADDLDEMASIYAEGDKPTPDDRLEVVTGEWMREEVGITLVGKPSEKSMADDFIVQAYTGWIVGAELGDRP